MTFVFNIVVVATGVATFHVAKFVALPVASQSGSGKSTLQKCLGAVVDPSAGRMMPGDEVIYDDGWRVAMSPLHPSSANAPWL